MGRMLITISDELEKEFRETIAKVYGVKKGAISRAVEEAIRMWIEKYREKEQ